jgi:hypothetical protein
MDGVDVEIRTVDGSGWARVVGDSVTEAGVWFVDNIVLVGGVLLAAVIVWLLLRSATRGGTSGW